MTRAPFKLICALGTVAVVGACNSSKSDSARAHAPSDSTRDMAGMPGMTANAKGDSARSGKGEADEAGKQQPTGVVPPTLTLSAAQIQHGGVRWASVTMGTASGSAVVPGQVVPDEDKTTRLGSPARGRVLSVAVRPGDRVSAGQVLVTMESPEAGVAQSDLAKANAEVASQRAEMKYAASARARAERLLALKAIPRQDYERAVTDAEHASAALAQAEAEARRARTTSAQLSAGVEANGEVVLRAPRAGIVLVRSAVPGAVVDAGAPLVVITDPTNLWLTVDAPEQMAALFHRAGPLRFTVPAFAADTFSARVDAVAPGLDPETRTLAVRGVITNATQLKPGMLATVMVEGVGSTTAAFVPDDAVQVVQGKPNVFLARPDGKGGARFERREVAVGARSGGRIAVLRGLEPTDVVVVGGAFAVKAEFEKANMPKMEM